MLYNWFNMWGPCSDQAGYGYPYSNFHQLNLDWFLGEFKKIVAEMLEHDTLIAGKVDKSGDTMTGTLNMGNNAITALKDPVNSSDAANKDYVDNRQMTVPIATNSTVGGIKANQASSTDTQDVNITPDGHLKTASGSYTLPVANNIDLGGIRAAAATQLDTQDVHVTADGHLKTKPTGGSGGGGLQPITVTRPAVYITKPNDTNTTQDLADPTAPQAHPIVKDQIAVYSETNQTYREDDVVGTLLVADPHSSMEAVNKRFANNNYLQLTGVKKMAGNIDMDTYSINNLRAPTGTHDAANKEYVDGSAKTTLPASGTALTANTIYTIPDTALVTTYKFTAPGTGQAHGRFKTGGTVNITFNTGDTFIASVPTFTANTVYEFDVLNKCWIFAKVVTA